MQSESGALKKLESVAPTTPNVGANSVAGRYPDPWPPFLSFAIR